MLRSASHSPLATFLPRLRRFVTHWLAAPAALRYALACAPAALRYALACRACGASLGAGLWGAVVLVAVITLVVIIIVRLNLDVIQHDAKDLRAHVLQ